MGKADVLTKQYMQDPAVFADAINLFVYNGEQVIKPEQLYEMDTTAMAELYGKEGESVTVQVYRDLMKYVTAKEDGEFAYLILGIENQTAVHYAMPVRNMLYDALQYYRQVQEAAKQHRKSKKRQTHEEILSGFRKTDKLLPVITLVVYFGTKPWKAPKSIYEMLSVKEPRALAFVTDYKINLLSPITMSDDDIEKLRTDLKNVFYYIKYARDEKKLQEVMESKDAFLHMKRPTAELLNTVTHSKLKYPEGEEEINMCKAIQDMRNESIAIGEARGEARGEIRGKLLGSLYMLYELVCDGLLTLAQAAAKAKLTEEQFKKQMEEAGYSLA